jgi:protein-S-isoprenylcysteine O-methyltransferase Ste14
MSTAERATPLRRLARWRVPLGFASAGAAFVLATPTESSLLTGLAIALPGAVLRIWAAGHIEKGREITRSGPYRLVRHPLYIGSALLGIGFSAASANLVVLILAVTYLSLTLAAAIRTEEATLDAKFPGQYSEYRAGTAPAVERPFSWARVWRNHEYRAMAGFIVAFGILVLRTGG